MRKTVAGWIGVGALWTGLAACGSPVERPGPSLTPAERAARFPEDLGPDTLDIKDVPALQRGNYAVFAHRCSRCHTLARPLNSSLTGRSAWARYVSRMRNKPTCLITNRDADRIVNFLVYDSETRRRTETFRREQALLKARFEQLTERRRAENQAEGQRLGRTDMPGPQPAPRPTR